MAILLSPDAERGGGGPILLMGHNELMIAGLAAAIRGSSPLSSRQLAAEPCGDALRGCGEAAVALILLDIQTSHAIGGSDPLQDFERLRRQYSGVPIAIVSALEFPELMRRALRAGAAGVIPSCTPLSIVCAAIQLMLAGGTHVPIQMIWPTHEQEPAPDLLPAASLAGLTVRQQAVLERLLKAESNKEIAHYLGLSVGTVKNYVSVLLRMANMTSRGRLVASQNPGEVAEVH
ncbi:MAG: response regulator transcription factor [Steroidobacteraceae bacterium]